MFGNLSFKRFKAKPLQRFGYQKRCLAVAAVILFGLVYLNLAKSPTKNEPGALAQENKTAIEEKATDSLGARVLGSAFDLGAGIPAAQAAFDFTSDDSQENEDFAIFQNSGLVSNDSPVPPAYDPFGNASREVRTYTVQSGDTPFDIAVKFNINTDTILWANNLRDGDLIKPGDQLLILPINGVRVKVGAKDTLETIAKKYNGKTSEIAAFNKLPDNNLATNSFIIIPNGETTTPNQAKPKITAPRYAVNLQLADDWLIAPATGYDWGRIHGNNAVDIANICGTPVYAAAAGTVIISDSIGWNGGYGKYIEIKHLNGVVTLYGHSSQLLVSVGDQVGQGQLIMLMGTTGRSTGCHVHFEVRGAHNPMAIAKK